MRKMFLLASLTLAACCATTPVVVDPLTDKLEIQSVQPRAVDAGDIVIVTGAGFTKNLSVRIGSRSVVPTAFTDKQLTVNMPDLGRGQYQVEVKNPNGVIVTHRGPVILGKDILTTTGPNSVPSIVEGQVMISIPAGNFPDRATLETYLRTKYPNFLVRVLQFYPPIVPGSDGPCGKSLAVLASTGTNGATTKDILNELATKFPELKDIEWEGVGHSNYAGGGLQAQDVGDGASDWARQAIHMPIQKDLYLLTEKLSSIKVAVLDTGISDHLEFQLNTENVIDRNEGRNFTTEEVFRDVNSTLDGYTPDGALQFEDSGGHGTPIASIIAALNGNQNIESSDGSMVGVAAGVHIIPIKVCYRAKGGTRSEMPPPYCPGIAVAAGICQAIAKSAQVINLSLGGPQSSSIINAILQEAAKKNISIVASAGNNESSDEYFPAAYGATSQNGYNTVPGLIAVGATKPSFDSLQNSQGIASYSNRGYWIDIMAPGGSQNSDFSLNAAANYRSSGLSAYNSFEGTSFAAPFVTGTVALLRAKFPTLTASQIKDKIKASATKMSCSSTVCGAGLLNISKSLDIPQNTGTAISSRP